MNPINLPSASSESAPDPNDILADTRNIFTRPVTLVSGQIVERGAALGKITSGGKYKWSASADSDGSQTITVIAAEDMDASGGDKTIQVHFRGDFKENMIKFNTGHTAASTFEALAARGICLHKVGLY